MVKILDITYVNSYLKQVADNSNQMNVEDKNLLLSLLGDFGDLFDGTLGDWSTESAGLELNPNYKPFPLDLYLIDHFIGQDRCHRWPGQTAFPDQNHPNSRMPNF